MFDKEKQRQLNLIPRIDKIEVRYNGVPEDVNLSMNKGISTPFNVAQRKKSYMFLHRIGDRSSKFCLLTDLSEMLVDRSALAMVDDQLWDMHRPLENDGTIVKLLHFHDKDPFQVNKVFWRSCSFLLGMACQSVFGEHVPLQLHSFPAPNSKLTYLLLKTLSLGVTYLLF